MMAQGDEGWGRSVTLEGQSIYAAFSRSVQSGWSVAVGIPAQQIDEAVRQSLATVGIGLFVRPNAVRKIVITTGACRWWSRVSVGCAKAPFTRASSPAISLTTLRAIKAFAAQEPTVLLPAHDPDGLVRLRERRVLA